MVSTKPAGLKKLTEFENYLGFETKIKWSNVLLIFFVHSFSAYWVYHYGFPVKWQTLLLSVFMYGLGAMGGVVGIHRLWSHRSFKATLPLQILLLAMFALTGQSSIKSWARNHRLHHKASDTDLDPHNRNRGLFYSHLGWLMLKKTPKLIEHAKKMDVSDLDNDPLVMWHERNVIPFNLMMAIVLPTVANVWLVGEAWRCAVAWQCCGRYLATLHAQSTVNSLAHAYGDRPFNKTIQPANNWFVSLVTWGEGSHNYHHTFPFDYRGMGQLKYSNPGTLFIKLFQSIGWAYDLKEAPPEMIQAVMQRKG